MEVAVADSKSTKAREDRVPGRARTCVGCGERVAVPDAELVRLILGPEGEIAIDPGDGGFGRGAHVHARPACLTRAASGGLARAAKGKVHLVPSPSPLPLTAETLAAAIADVYTRRANALIGSAIRARAVHIGSDAVADACRNAAPLVLVACDAAAAAETTEVRRAIAEGRAIAWGTKASLGEVTRAGREAGVAVLAIDSTRIAAALRQATTIVTACTSLPSGPERAAGSRGGGNGSGRAERGNIRKKSRTERGS